MHSVTAGQQYACRQRKLQTSACIQRTPRRRPSRPESSLQLKATVPFTIPTATTMTLHTHAVSMFSVSVAHESSPGHTEQPGHPTVRVPVGVHSWRCSSAAALWPDCPCPCASVSPCSTQRCIVWLSAHALQSSHVRPARLQLDITLDIKQCAFDAIFEADVLHNTASCILWAASLLLQYLRTLKAVTQSNRAC